MDLNADFAVPVIVDAENLPWVASPMAGVDRRMLDRIGDEVARATTIVRYAPASKFSAHTHTGGEEFIVLEGVFQDEHGDYPAGTYVRNPPTSSHTPGSDAGCTIFVKLWQFDKDDRTQFRMSMTDTLGTAVNGVQSGVMHQDDREKVTYHHIAEGAVFDRTDTGGIEALVLNGALLHEGKALNRHAWIRLPEGAPFHATGGAGGAQVWMKTGHLPFAAAPAL